MNRRQVAVGIAGLSAAASLTALPAQSASGMAVVVHPDEVAGCAFDPGDVPGVDVSFPARCTLVFLDSGRLQVVARGHLPEGYSLARTFVGPVPCLGETGRIVATVSGQVTAICHL